MSNTTAAIDVAVLVGSLRAASISRKLGQIGRALLQELMTSFEVWVRRFREAR